MPAAELDWGWIARLSAAHLVNDLNQSAVVGVLPVLVAQRGLSYVVASCLMVALTLSSAVVQPALGQLADRRPGRSPVRLALLVGAAGVACLGLLGTTAGVAIAVLTIGAATAGFHPGALETLGRTAGSRGTTALAVFAVGGNLGTALGPVVAAALVGALGMPGLGLALVPSIAMAALVAERRAGGARPVRPGGAARGPVRWAGFARFIGVLVVRSALAYFVATFVALYLVRHAGMTTGRAGLLVTATLVSGVVVSPVAAWLADRTGDRAVLLGSLLPLGPLLYLLPSCAGALRVACLLAIGAATMAPYSVAIAAAQRCLPGREGLAGGIAMGVGSVGSVALLGFGVIADRAGLPAAFHAAAVLPAVAALLAVPRST